jgi:hypothetical protein
MNKAKGIDFKGGESTILIGKRLEKAHGKMQHYTFSLAPYPLPLFRTDFILKIITKIKENMLINGIKI